MAFVREKISQEDFEKYRIAHFDERIPNALRPGSLWVIDRDKNTFLMNVSRGWREPNTYNRHKFIFYINGDLYFIILYLTIKRWNEYSWSLVWKMPTWSFVSLNSTNHKMMNSSPENSTVLKQALEVFRFPDVEDDYIGRIDISLDFKTSISK